MRKGWMILLMLCLLVKGGQCRSGDNFKDYLEDQLRKYSTHRYDVTRIKEDEDVVTYSIVPRNDLIGIDGLITKIMDARPLPAYKGQRDVTADKSAQSEFSYYFHSVKKGYVYILFLRKRTIPPLEEGEEAIEDVTHKILVVPLKGHRKNRGEIELSYYDARRKQHVKINKDYHILLELRGKDKLKIAFKGAAYDF